MSVIKKAFLNAIGNKVFEPARIASVADISEHFRLVVIEAPSFKEAPWNPGEKIQINTGDWNVRTYTPISTDAALGQMKILVYMHGNGPGSKWASVLNAGQECQVMGPRTSLDFSKVEGQLVFAGDETSFGVCLSYQNKMGSTSGAKYFFEVNSVEESTKVLNWINLSSFTLVQKQTDGSHLKAISEKIAGEVVGRAGAVLMLTGHAQSIERIRAELKAKNISPTAGGKTKVYWSDGKVGID
jgi:ferric-chelate reductase (NADPH)